MYLRGSYTVEAALVFPIVLFSVLFVVYSAFYMHNQAVVHEVAYETAVYATTLDRKDTGKMKQKIQEKYLHSIENRLISMQQPNVSVTVEDNKMTIGISGAMNTAEGSLIPGYDHMVIKAQKTIAFHDPKQTVRVYKKMKGLIKK